MDAEPAASETSRQDIEVFLHWIPTRQLPGLHYHFARTMANDELQASIGAHCDFDPADARHTTVQVQNAAFEAQHNTGLIQALLHNAPTTAAAKGPYPACKHPARTSSPKAARFAGKDSNNREVVTNQ